MHPITRSLLASAVVLTLAVPAVPAVAQEEGVATTTISAIERGEAQGMVYLEGAALERAGDGGDEVLFSDGTGTIRVQVDDDAGEGEMPLFELVGIEGTLAAGEIDVSRWALLRIVTPAVIVEEPQVVEAFWGWIVAYGSQAPEATE
jgi:uncharacterized protein YdeI (BOF family)